MKNIFIAMLVLVFAFASSVYADERVELKGEMRVVGFSGDNYENFDDDDRADNYEFFEQRFRFGMKINIAKGVSANFRADFAEAEWGYGFKSGSTARPDDSVSDKNELHIDRTYLKIKKGIFDLRAGQHLISLGNKIAMDYNGTGFQLRIKPKPFRIRLFWAKKDEGGGLDDESDVNPNDSHQDTNYMGAQVRFKSDAFGAKVFYALQDDRRRRREPTVAGLCGDANIGAVKLKAELNVYGGEREESNQDYMGTNFYLDGSGAAGPATVGAMFFYGKGNDNPDKRQLNHLTNFYDWRPVSYAALPGVWDPIEEGLGKGHDGDGHFEAFDDDSGVMMLLVYGEAKVADIFTLAAMAGYGKPEEDSVTDKESMWLVNLGATYHIATNTALHLGFNYISLDFDDTYTGKEDNPMGLLMKLNVKW